MTEDVFNDGSAPLKLLLLGGQKSGKSRQAELLARQWLQGGPARSASLIATGTAYDAEMHARIARHQSDRATRVPQLATVEVPRDVAHAIATHSQPQHLLIIDCLTLWLTNWLMPGTDFEQNTPIARDWSAQSALFLVAIEQAPGPVILVSNEIGLGVIPMGREVRAFVDALGVLNQQTAAACNRVHLMAAGVPLRMK